MSMRSTREKGQECPLQQGLPRGVPARGAPPTSYRHSRITGAAQQHRCVNEQTWNAFQSMSEAASSARPTAPWCSTSTTLNSSSTSACPRGVGTQCAAEAVCAGAWRPAGLQLLHARLAARPAPWQRREPGSSAGLAPTTSAAPHLLHVVPNLLQPLLQLLPVHLLACSAGGAWQRSMQTLDASTAGRPPRRMHLASLREQKAYQAAAAGDQTAAPGAANTVWPLAGTCSRAAGQQSAGDMLPEAAPSLPHELPQCSTLNHHAQPLTRRR